MIRQWNDGYEERPLTAASTLRQGAVPADAPIVNLPLPAWWTWRQSARWRRVWLAYAWVLVLFRGALGPAAFPLAALRTAGSMVQFGWNLRLGRRQPLPRPGFADWILVGITLAAAAGYSAATHTRPTGWSWTEFAAGLTLLVPYSLVQLRAAEHCLRAEILAGMEHLVAARPVPMPLERQWIRRAAAPVVFRRAA
ncbi:hypothetical protein HRbin29_00832 [bacterium HR29]|jgi:hypothetical protein|nr:hypothetical protein HRbin29_00832 [bacterium HR29]